MSKKMRNLNSPPKTPLYRLIWSYLFRGLNAKLTRHWYRSLNENDARHLAIFSWLAWRKEQMRREQHLLEMSRPPANYDRTKIKPLF